MPNAQKIVVLASGGIDSTTCIALAVSQVGRDNVIALNMFYGQKHEKELECAKKVAAFYSIPYYEMNLSGVLQYSDCPLLQHSSREIAHESYAEQLEKLGGEGMVDTYVPFRNGLFLSAAAAFAQSMGAGKVYYGAHADDAAGRAYPDCTPAFQQAMALAISEGTGGQVQLEAPLIFMNKTQVVQAGLRLQAPYADTWSCYEGGAQPCGTCATCIDRAKAFANNGVPDPALPQNSQDIERS